MEKKTVDGKVAIVLANGFWEMPEKETTQEFRFDPEIVDYVEKCRTVVNDGRYVELVHFGIK